MIKRKHMQQKYFLRRLVHHLVIITLPLLILGISLTMYYRRQLRGELSVYAERSKNYILNSITDVLNTFSAETALFSTTPSIASSLYRLLNEQSLNYKNNVYRALIPTIINSTSNISNYVDSIYIYYDNPYGNFFSSYGGYTSITAPNCIDTQWLNIYQDTSSDTSSWIMSRHVRQYSFESGKETISVFRRFDYLKGVMVLNLNLEELSRLLSSNQIYQGACTLIADSDKQILFGSPNWEQLITDSQLPVQVLHQFFDDTVSYDTAIIDNTGYVYYSSPIEDYDLIMVSLLPMTEVFRPVNHMVFAFSLITLFSIILSISLSLRETLHNFRQLNHLLELFSNTESNQKLPTRFREDARNEYDLIFNNIIETFVTNNMLKLNLAQAKIQQKDAQLTALQLQLNPHFIFNTLQTLDMEILRRKPDISCSRLLIHNLSDILKYSLENSSHQVTIRDEIQICKSYAEIQKLRYQNPFILYWDYDEEVLEMPIIHLILQPLLENSLQHGIKERPGNGLVKIKIFKRENSIRISIIDNGVGISRSKLDEIKRQLQRRDLTHVDQHIGLFNTNLRLILTYGSGASLHIYSKEGWGTIVQFQFNYK